MTCVNRKGHRSSGKGEIDLKSPREDDDDPAPYYRKWQDFASLFFWRRGYGRPVESVLNQVLDAQASE